MWNLIISALQKLFWCLSAWVVNVATPMEDAVVESVRRLWFMSLSLSHFQEDW